MVGHLWWQEQRPLFLIDVVNHVNQARGKAAAVERCSQLYDAFNILWKPFFQNTDTQAFIDLLNKMGYEHHTKLFSSPEFENVVRLRPMVMNHDVLRRAKYDPQDIPEDLIESSQALHRKLEKKYNEYLRQRGNINRRNDLVEVIGRFLYMVRSNIKHGEKTVRGPDLMKVHRDRAVCGVVGPLLELIFEQIFDYPSRRLVSYGTLKPGKVNHGLLEDVKGEWHEVLIQGTITEEHGLEYFSWSTAAERIQAQMLVSPHPIQCFPELDQFEGREYERIWIPVLEKQDKWTIANIYAKRDSDRG